MNVELIEGDPGGLASMIAGLIEQNLERDPSRRRLLRPVVFSISVPDADVSVTVRVAPDRVQVADGAGPACQIAIVADSASLLELAATPLRFGLPDPFLAPGRGIVRDVIRRRIRIRGMLRHPMLLGRVAALLSVA